MTFYTGATILIELMMLTMLLHVLHYSGFTKQQKIWFSLTFVSIIICSLAEYAVHCGVYDKVFDVPLTVLTAIQFSLSPCLAVFFSGALGLHRQAKRALCVFALNAVVECVSAPFGLVFLFNETGYVRGPFFIVYELCYFLAFLYLIVSMVFVGRQFRHRDATTIVMIVVLLLMGIVPMTLYKIQIAYFSIGLCATLCYIYYNDLVQEDNREELIANQKRMSRMQEHTISGLANLIESRDTDTGEHVARTSRYVKLIAERAMRDGVYADQIDEHFISLLYMLAPMHDVGKIVVPDQILKKPGRLTPEEYEQMKQHASAGGAVVRQMLSGLADEEYIRFASDIATCHHEKWDGTGYPMGLKGEGIPLCARIMAIADVYDALISKRCYKEPMSVEQALEIIRTDAGTHFDPKLAGVFLKCISENAA
ncbi:MAG: HD domain-containing protein [Oscillospiraceae bacterium]|nr:HD domain-containing protein [Oscillospiraceae bacterium]